MRTEKRRNFLIHFSYFALLVLAAFVFVRFLLPPLAPFVIAFVIAYLMKAPIGLLKEKLHVPGKLAAILTVLLFYGIIGGLVSLLGLRALSGLSKLLQSLPTLYSEYIQPLIWSILIDIEEFIMRMDASLMDALEGMGAQFVQSLGNMVSSLSVKAMSAVSGLASALPGLFIKLVVMIISTFFIAIDYERLTGFCLRQLNEKARNIVLEIKEYLIGTLFVCIRSYFIIMSITFVELSIGLTLIRIPHGILIAFLIAIFDILPVLGTGGIMIPWTVLSLLQGNLPRALGLLVIYLVITIIRNIIEPKIVGKQLGLHPVVTLACMFVGAQFAGVIGLFGLPIGLSLLCYLNEHKVISIFK